MVSLAVLSDIGDDFLLPPGSKGRVTRRVVVVGANLTLHSSEEFFAGQ